jgi:uncharacterized protein (UPF0276 family)
MNGPRLGRGIGWRPELAWAIERRTDLGFVELLAEDFEPQRPLPVPLRRLQERGVTLIPHGVTLSLAGAEPPDRDRLDALAALARRCKAPLVSEHIAFVRAGGIESGHLLPPPRTAEAVEVLVENIRLAKAALPVPLALENVASLFDWPHPEFDEASFLTELLEQADVGLLLDIENVYANARNLGGDPVNFLDRLPLSRIAYVHIAGGVERAGVYHDTHAHPVPRPVLELLEELCARTDVPGVLLERDDRFPTEAELNEELDAIAGSMQRGAARRARDHAVL